LLSGTTAEEAADGVPDAGTDCDTTTVEEHVSL
jgi:hypothetical protein